MKVIRTAFIYFLLMMPLQLNAATYLWDCDGVVSNAYLSTSPEYREVRKAKHVSAMPIYMRTNKPCEVRIDGMLYKMSITITTLL